MKYFILAIYLISQLLSANSLITVSSAHKYEPFLHCLSHRLSNSTSVVYTPNDPSYDSILNSTIMNPHAALSFSTTPKALAIVTPSNTAQVQATLSCCKSHGVQIRTQSGGHDSEGLSYLSRVPHVILDLRELSSVDVDVERETAWVQAGATLGELYYAIAEKSGNLGFPAGLCYTVGVGGHFSGGGYGLLTRKYGLAADNIVDAVIVDVEGEALNRESMGEDLFWAIRGGGAVSFGVVVAWKIKLVRVPPKLTFANLAKDLKDDETKKLVQRWQFVADKLHEDLLLTVGFEAVNSSTEPKTKMKLKPKLQASFTFLFLGQPERLLSLMEKSFPELSLAKKDCTEMTWIQAILFFNGFAVSESPKALLDKTRPQGKPMSLLLKSDYIQEPIQEKVLERLWERLVDHEDYVGIARFQMFPYGAKMAEIPWSDIPYPHRAGNIYELTYLVRWAEEGDSLAATVKRHRSWIRSAHSFMTPYVSKNPRGAYLNYRDLDLRTNNDHGYTSYEQASAWGLSYFKDNFQRLVHVKTKVDPTNFFRNEQSIPPLTKFH